VQTNQVGLPLKAVTCAVIAALATQYQPAQNLGAERNTESVNIQALQVATSTLSAATTTEDESSTSSNTDMDQRSKGSQDDSQQTTLTAIQPAQIEALLLLWSQAPAVYNDYPATVSVDASIH
jgi:hypothetical protein